MTHPPHGDKPLVLLGIKMPQALKDKIQQAAELDERTMSDWARIKLRDAATEVIEKHVLKSMPDLPAEITYRMGNG